MGVQERIREYRRLDRREELPNVAGGLGLAVAECFKILDTKPKNPSPEHWDRAFRLFDLLL
jgi:hypothetical protein